MAKTLILACGLALATFVPFAAANPMDFKLLYAFQGSYEGPDGAEPSGGLIADKVGNLYGVTLQGGSGFGTIFELPQNGTEKVLYAFKGGTDGAYPVGTLVEDGAGNLYGATQQGGEGCSQNNCGTIFKLAPDGTETVLHAFKAPPDGDFPDAGLIADRHGRLYGTTSYGGTNGGYGTVFRLALDGKETVLYSFKGGSDGEFPLAPLIFDHAGNLYGTTFGPNPTECDADCGTVFELAPDGTETVLYDFCSTMYCVDGSGPDGGLIADSADNLYGTTSWAGNVFRLAPDGTETVLHSFDGPDGWIAVGSLVADRQGNLYGVTVSGGAGACRPNVGCGTVFEIAPDGTETLLHSFEKKTGDYPNGNLISINGYLYGTTESGGGSSNCGTNRKNVPYGCGTVFAIQK